MQPTGENLERFLPQYLTDASKRELIAALKALPVGERFYTARVAEPGPMQGDLTSGLVAFSHPDGARQVVSGLVLSNSCDLSADNERMFAKDLVFALVYPLEAIERALQAHGFDAKTVSGFLENVRAQRVTSLFYLPPEQSDGRELLANLSQLHSVPMKVFHSNNATRKRRLSNIGFYTLAFKLSVHFCRLHENVDRSP